VNPAGKRHAGRRLAAAILLLLAAALIGWSMNIGPFKQMRAYRDGLRAYAYGFPLLLMQETKHAMSADAGSDSRFCRINQIIHAQHFLNAQFREVVRPNVDTLYSSAWLDLSTEPVVLHVPDMQGRYHLLPMLDAWTNVFAAPGSRTTGDKGGDYVIVGPRFSGSVPEGLTRLDAPTDMAWMIGRVMANGSEDVAAVNALQARMTLTPLSLWRAGDPANADAACVPLARAADGRTPVARLLSLDADAFFARLVLLMKNNPPAQRDAAMLAMLAQLGMVPGQPFAMSTLDADQRAGLTQAHDTGGALARRIAQVGKNQAAPEEQGMLAALPKILMQRLAETKNGWTYPRNLGDYGSNYVFRALVSLIGLGANLDADALYPNTAIDATGEALDGSRRYVLHFDKQALPPVAAFWSLTMYGKDNYFVDNRLDRYALGSLTRGLRYNDDGSLDLHIQNQAPATGTSNWLPAPAGNFILNLRLYWPQPEALDGRWRAPAVQRLD
jgi:hypothetical protein